MHIQKEAPTWNLKFGEKLDFLLKERGWSINELSRQIGQQYATVYRWMGRNDGGKVKPVENTVLEKPARKSQGHKPSPQDLIRLSDKLDCDIRWLIDENMGLEDRPILTGDVRDRMLKLSQKDALEALELLFNEQLKRSQK